MRASRGMGDISPTKMPKAKRAKRRDDTSFDEYSQGGKVSKNKHKVKKVKKNESYYSD